jgi:hypothetical protein
MRTVPVTSPVSKLTAPGGRGSKDVELLIVHLWSRDHRERSCGGLFSQPGQHADKVITTASCGRGSQPALPVINNVPSRDHRERYSLLSQPGLTKSLDSLLSYWLAARRIADTLWSTSSSRVAQEETLMRIAARPCHSVGPHQQVPSFWTRSITWRVRAASPKETRT